MMLLSKVEDVFEFEGRGCVLVPGISDSVPKDFVVRFGDPIELRKPDGSVVRTHIYGIEIPAGPNRRKDCFPISLPPEFTKRGIPIGTEVWLALG